MRNLTSRVLRKAIREAVALQTNGLAPGYFLDLVVFWLGINAYQKLRGNDDKHLDVGARLVRRFHGEMIAGIQQFIVPLIENPAFTRFKAPVAIAVRPTPGLEQVGVQAEMLADILSVLRAKHAELKTTFSEPRAAAAAQKVANLASNEAPETVLNGLATVPPASRLQTTRAWLKEAARLAGVAPSEVEGVLADAEAAKNLGDDLRQVETKLSRVDPLSQDAADLQGQKQDILTNIEAVVSTSDNPAVIMSAAAVAASQPKDYATKIGKAKGLSPDQERAMMVRGKGIIAAGAGSGKCIVGHTLVQTMEGFIPIGELGQGLDAEQDALLEMTIHGLAGPEKTSHVYCDGVRQTRRVVTRQGYEIEGTSPHKILTLRDGSIEWAPLGDIIEGDVVCIDRRQGMFPESPFRRTPDDPRVFRTSAVPETNIPLDLTPQVASLLGWIISEGYIRQNAWNISLVTTDPEQRDMYQQAVQGLIIPVWSEDNRQRKQFVMDFWRAADVRALMGFGLTRTLAGEKNVPIGILRSPKIVIAAFLRSLFDGDGCVTNRHIEFCTASETLARQVQVLLTAFSILSRRKYRPNNGQGAWYLIIAGTGLRTFADEIGFGLSTKAEGLRHIVQTKCNTNIDLIPGVSHLCRMIKEHYTAKTGTTRTADADYGTFKCISAGSRQPSFNTLKGFLDFYRVEDSTAWRALKTICDSGWFFDTVDEITEHDAPVYDFVVPGTYSFSAGGFINHNTRVLASKVIYHMDDLGVPAQSIMATSFSRKSAAELHKRIEDFGGVFPQGTDTGLGTTHSVAAKLMREYGGGRASRDGMKSYEQTNLVRLAMQQVQMPGAPTPPPAPQSLFTPVSSPATPATPEEPRVPTTGLSFEKAMNMAYANRGRLSGFLRSFIEGFFNPSDKWYRMNRSKTKDLTDPYGLTEKQQSILMDVFQYTRVQYHPDDDPVLKGMGRVAKKRDKDKGLREKYPTFAQPVGQWFNLGLKLTSDGTDEGEPIPAGHFKQAITKYKGRLVSPTEAWAQAESGAAKKGLGVTEAAVYAAYEFLKGPSGEQDFRGKGDFDDVLIDVSKMLLTDPKALKQVQARFKVVLVDEAQDLNRCVSGDTEVQTLDGPKCVRDLTVGERVFSYENGRVVYNRVKDKVGSAWRRGYRIVTESGRSLTMSPDHRIYATPVAIPDGQLALYLMYRNDMGFRIGTTTRLFEYTENGSPGRAQAERADCAWVLEIGDPEDILYKETAFSLERGIPTLPYEAAVHGCNQDRTNRVFQAFGENGRALMEKYDLDFDRPHWTGDVLDSIHIPVYTLKNDRKMINKLAVSYEETATDTARLARSLGIRVDEALVIGDQKLPLVTASALFPGMAVLVMNGDVDLRHTDLCPIQEYRDLADRLEIDISHLGGSQNTGKAEIHDFLRSVQMQRGLKDVLPARVGACVLLDRIERVEPVEHDDFWDIAVEGASNFFGNGVLSHNSQHMMFGLITGFVDPAKTPKVASAKQFAELAKDDGSMTADTYCFIGDDKQCLEVSSMISTNTGQKPLSEVREGDCILSYRNGDVVEQVVCRVVPSTWTWGYQVTLASGRSLTMSPNHKLWATEPTVTDDEHLVYLMYRRDLGFRAGITNRERDDDHVYLFGQRPVAEKAEKLWILNVCLDRETALTLENTYSLRYQIPTLIYHTDGRDLSEAYKARNASVYAEFGQNGVKLLTDKHLSSDLPHWVTRNSIKMGRYVIQVVAHGPRGTQVNLEVGPEVCLGDFPYKDIRSGARLVRKWFLNYREASRFAEALRQQTGAMLAQHLSSSGGSLRKVTASGLFPGMELVVTNDDGQIEMDTIIRVEKADGIFHGIDVDDASNLFANQILTGNSIYEFRGADPETFIDMSDLVEGGAGFKTELLKTNYRSGELIVQAANRLIAHNSRQIPMTCDANPNRISKGGISRIPFPPVEGRDMTVPAKWLATRIEEMMELGEAEKGYDSFGVGLRSNAEAYTYGLEMLKRGIPFRARTNFFSDPNTKALLFWLALADEGINGNMERVNDTVLNARSAPVSMLGQKFVDTLSEKATGNYLQWLQVNWQQVYGPRSAFSANVKAYLDNLLLVGGIKNEQLSNEQVLDQLIKLQGFDGSTVEDALVDKVREDDEAMAELRAASPNGEVHEDDIREQAFAPIAPLTGLLGARANLTEAMKYVRTLQGANNKLAKNDDPDSPDFKQPAVTLGTMHSWKGLEVENMFVPMVGGKFPRTDADEEDLASERRLGYVSLTRGENNVFVMDIPTVRMTPKGGIVLTSQFVDEMCLPTTTKAASAQMAPPLPHGMSPHDPAMMDAYLRGEMAQNMGLDTARLARVIDIQGDEVIVSLQAR